MTFLFLSLIAFVCVSAFPYDKTIIENLDTNVKAFHDALQTANPALATTLGTTSACPCNVFDAYALDQVAVYTAELQTCLAVGNTTAVEKCLVDNMCIPFKALAANPCGGYFNSTLAQNNPAKSALVVALLNECQKLMGAPIVINDACKADQVEDFTVFAVNAAPGADLVQYHVVKNAYTQANLFQKNYVESVYEDAGRPQYVEVVVIGQGNTTVVQVTTNFVTQTYANVTQTFAGSNGFVHVLSSPMSLPLAPSVVLSQIATLSSLSAAVVAEGLVATLDGLDEMTLLAPVDTGFAGFPFFANLTDRLRTLTIQSHLVVSPTGSPLFSTDIAQSNGVVVNTSSGLALKIKVEGANIGFVAPEDDEDRTYVVMADIITTNGVIHVVDAVLRPIIDTKDNDIVDNLFLDERLTGFASLIADSAPAFLSKLRTANNITLFAPQNLSSDAAGRLGITEIEALLDYHTLTREILSTDLVSGMNAATTQLEDPEFVRLDGKAQTIFVVSTPGTNDTDALVQLQSSYPSDNVDVTVANLECVGNNVIHIVSAPAKVPVDTVSTLRNGGYEFLAASFGNNTELNKMINGYPNEYNNATSVYTVFASHDSAYKSLSAEANLTEVSVMQDQVALLRVLSADLIKFLKRDAVNGSFMLSMLSNKTVKVELKGEHVYVGGWKVIATDILTANGVVHILEGAIGTSPKKKSEGLSPGVLAAIIVGSVAFLGLLCYCFFMKGEDGSDEEKQPFAPLP